MPAEITPLQFWLGILTVLLPQIYNIYKAWRDAKSNEPLVEAQADEKVFQAWEKLAAEYVRQIDSLRNLETENATLRPLVLKIALQEQEMSQCREDKEDWKRYAQKLAKQLEEDGKMPLPFRRTPSDGDTGKHTTVRVTPVADEDQATS